MIIDNKIDDKNSFLIVLYGIGEELKIIKKNYEKAKEEVRELVEKYIDNFEFTEDELIVIRNILLENNIKL